MSSPVAETDHLGPPSEHPAAPAARGSSESIPASDRSPNPDRIGVLPTRHPSQYRIQEGVWDGGDPTCIWLG